MGLRLEIKKAKILGKWDVGQIIIVNDSGKTYYGKLESFIQNLYTCDLYISNMPVVTISNAKDVSVYYHE
jgi:hypothetical protein